MRREDSFGRDRLVARRGFAWCVLRLAGGRGVLAPSVEAAAVTGATVASPLTEGSRRRGRLVAAAVKHDRGSQVRVDSPLEQAGFELSVPPERKAFPRALNRFRRPSVTRRQAWPHRATEAGA